MKQLLFCYKKNRKLKLRQTMLTDVFVPVQDVISPQKSTLIIPKTDKIEVSDFIIIRDNDSGIVEYIGYIDTLKNEMVTEISCYPLINVFDNDYVLDQLFQPSTNVDGTIVDIAVDVGNWIVTQLNRAFINTDDDLQALPLIIRNFIKTPVLYKNVLETSNLFEIYTDLFIKTGIYIVFSDLSYNGTEIDGIFCDIFSNKDEKPINLRFDNPQIQSVDIVNNTFTNYNKIIATEELEEGETREPVRYFFYLLNDNSISTDPTDERRIKQVRSKEISFNLDIDGEEEIDEDDEHFPTPQDKENEKNRRRANALIFLISNELQVSNYNLQINIEMFANANIKLYKRIDFLGKNGIIYMSNCTRIEILNDKQVKVTLGALRNSLTDFKKKIEGI